MKTTRAIKLAACPITKLICIGLVLLVPAGCTTSAIDIPVEDLAAHTRLIYKIKDDGGDIPEAKKEYLQLKRLHSDDPRVYYYLGLLDDDSSEFYLLKSLDLQPDFFAAHLQMGIIGIEQEQPGKALPHLNKAITLWPENDYPYYLSGVAHELKAEKAKLLRKRSPALLAKQLYTTAMEKSGGKEYAEDVLRMEKTLKDIEAAEDVMKRIAHLFTWVYSDGWFTMTMTFYSNGTWTGRTSLDHQQSYGTWSGDAYDLQVYEYGMFTDTGYVDPDDPNVLVLNTGRGTVRMRKR